MSDEIDPVLAVAVGGVWIFSTLLFSTIFMELVQPAVAGVLAFAVLPAMLVAAYALGWVALTGLIWVIGE